MSTDAALGRYKRTMRRLWRRARRMGVHAAGSAALHFASLRRNPSRNKVWELREMADVLRRELRQPNPQKAFLYERAADALAKLVAAGGAQ